MDWKRCLAMVCGGTLLVCGAMAVGCGDNAGNQKATFLSRAVELAELVNEVPLTADVHNGAKKTENKAGNDTQKTKPVTVRSDSTAFRSIVAPMTSGSIDVTDPADNSAYHTWPFADSEYARMTWADNYIEQIKQIKDIATDNIVQLGVWVDGFTSQYAQRIRLCYDSVNDVATIESLNTNVLMDGGIYWRIRSTYNADGNTVIDASLKSVDAGKVVSNNSVYYIENEEWLVCMDSDDTGNNGGGICYADLSADGNPYTFLSGDLLNYRFYMAGKPYVYFEMEHTVSEEYDAGYNYFLNDSNSDRIGKLFHQENTAVLWLDVYRLTGWDRLEKIERQDFGANSSTSTYPIEYKLTIGETIFGEEVKEFIVDGGHLDGGYTIRINTFPISGNCPALAFTVYTEKDENGKSKTAAEIVKTTMDYFGLSFKDEVVSEQIANADRVDELLKKFKAFGEDGKFYISKELFKERLAEYLTVDYSAADIYRYLDETTVAIDEQKKDETYYAIFSAETTGAVVWNTETDEADLSEITATVKKNALMQKSGEYVLCVAWCDAFHAHAVAETTAIWQDGDLSLTGLTTFSITELPIGEYSLKAYVAKKVDGGYLRISQLFDLYSDGEFTSEKIWETSVSTLNADETGISLVFVSSEK